MITRATITIALALVLYGCAASRAAQKGRSWNDTKELISEVYQDKQTTFYCGCRYHKSYGKLRVAIRDCGYRIRKNADRAMRVEWEHIVPAWWLGKQIRCWDRGGRAGCWKRSPKFRRALTDLHNLAPAIGEVNGDRNNYRFAELPGRAWQYGNCDFKVDFKAKKARPRPEIRGDIARTYFYMSDKYKLRMSKQQRRMFAVWDKQDPIDEWEIEKNRRIAEITGVENDYITEAEASR